MSFVSLVSALVLTQLGILSILIGAAYWNEKGAGVAAAAGLALIIIGAWSVIGMFRRVKETPRRS